MKSIFEKDGRKLRPSPYVVEFILVCGASLVAVFILIPNQTISGDEIGLSPGLIPTVCASLIGLLALIQFITTHLKREIASQESRVEIHHALLLMTGVVIGITAIWMFDLMIGCVLLAFLITLALGERRFLRVVSICGGVAILLFLIDQTGF